MKATVHYTGTHTGTHVPSAIKHDIGAQATSPVQTLMIFYYCYYCFIFFFFVASDKRDEGAGVLLSLYTVCRPGDLQPRQVIFFKYIFFFLFIVTVKSTEKRG